MSQLAMQSRAPYFLSLAKALRHHKRLQSQLARIGASTGLSLREPALRAGRLPAARATALLFIRAIHIC